MEKIIIVFYIASFLMACVAFFFIYRNLKDKSERNKLIIGVLISLAIAAIFILLGLQVPSIKFGRFM